MYLSLFIFTTFSKVQRKKICTAIKNINKIIKGMEEMQCEDGLTTRIKTDDDGNKESYR